MDTWPLLLLCLIILVTNVVKVYWTIKDYKLRKTQVKQQAKANYLLLKQTRTTQHSIVTKRDIKSTPLTDEPGERRRSG